MCEGRLPETYAAEEADAVGDRKMIRDARRPPRS